MFVILGVYKQYSNSIGNALIELFKSLILPIILILGLVVITTALYQKFKYGSNVMPSFKPKDVSNCRDQILFLILDRIPNYKKLLRIPGIKCNYLMIDKSGVSIFKLFTDVGRINGNSTDNVLKVQMNYNIEKSIPNPYLDLNQDYETISKLVPNIKINKYLITMDGSYISVQSDAIIIKYNQLLYQLKSEDLYNNKQVDEIYNSINKINVK